MNEWENGQIQDPQNPESESEVTEAEIVEIAGEPKYYTTGQVAKILGENESTIRFWCDEFDEFLKILRSGRNRQFTSLDIKRLEYIKYLLRKENFTIKQVKEFLSTKEAQLMRPVGKEREQIIIDALSKVIIDEIAQHFKSLEERIVEKILDELKKQFPYSLPETSTNIQDDIQKQNNQLLEKIDALEKKIAERDAQFISFLEKFRSKEKPKGLFEKLKIFFGKSN